MASAFRRASSISSSSVPLQRTRHGPEDSQKASPKAAPGTAVTSASCRSSTVLMKCACPRMRLTASGFSLGTTTRLTDMAPPGLAITGLQVGFNLPAPATAARSRPYVSGINPTLRCVIGEAGAAGLVIGPPLAGLPRCGPTGPHPLIIMIGNEALDRVHDPDVQAPAWPPVREVTPPDRYRIKRGRDGEVLTCIEAPTVTVRIKHGFCVTASAARSFAPGSIFLDGAAKGEPFIDPKRQVYNLDHHEGCVRSFTLATCEQAMVMIRKGLDLRKRDWTVYANDPDLDTVLAIWLLLNHIRLNEINGRTRARVMPLLRLQGVIDAQGLELKDLCGLPPELLAETQAWIDELRARELALKRRGRWQSSDLLRHTADRLRAIDRLVYPAKHFDDVAEIDELVRAEIAGGSVAIVCRSTAGIYEVERQLRRLHGRRLGVIALQRDAATYSLRQVDPYLPASLEKVYAHLNLIDPVAGGHRSGNRWGGSADIGGSPRGSGTGVSPEQIARVCEQAFSAPTFLRRLGRIGSAALRSTSVMTAALALAFILRLLDDRIGLESGIAPSLASQFPMLLLGFGGAFFLPRGRRLPGIYGLRRVPGFRRRLFLLLARFGALPGR